VNKILSMADVSEPIYRALILRVMVAMMKVDDNVEEHEVEKIGDIFEDVVGFRLEEPLRDRLIGSIGTSRNQVLQLIRRHREELDPAQRELILRAGYYIEEADLRILQREETFLIDIGLALGYTGDEIVDILEAMRKEGGTRFWRGC